MCLDNFSYNRKNPLRFLVLCLACLLSLTFGGCTSGGDLQGGYTDLLVFELELNPNASQTRSDTYYAILLNHLNEPIEPSNAGTYTDFIRIFDNQAVWYHRQSVVGQPVLEFVPVADVTNVLSRPNATTMRLTFQPNDPASVINQYILSSNFTTHALVSDRFQENILGRILDTIGPGLFGATNYTAYVSLTSGILEPLPPAYPIDNSGDQFHPPDSQLSNSFDADIIRFEVTTF